MLDKIVLCLGVGMAMMMGCEHCQASAEADCSGDVACSYTLQSGDVIHYCCPSDRPYCAEPNSNCAVPGECCSEPPQ